MKRFQIPIFIIVALALAYVTYDVIHALGDASQSEIVGWLSLTGLGVGASVSMVALLTVVLFVDFIWMLIAIIWLIRRKLQIKDNPLHLP